MARELRMAPDEVGLLQKCHKSVRHIANNLHNIKKWRSHKLYRLKPLYKHDLFERKWLKFTRLIHKFRCKYYEAVNKRTAPCTTGYGDIFLIPSSHYPSLGSFFYTLFHEIAHWSIRPGLFKIWDRDIEGFTKHDEDFVYNMEEVIVDLVAAKVCDYYKIPYSYRATSRYLVVYLQNFVKPGTMLLRAEKISTRLAEWIINKIIDNHGEGF